MDDGNYTIYVRAFDGADYSMIKSVTVYVDNPHEPELAITSDISEEVSGTITIKGTASDSDGEIIKVEIQIDDGEWKEAEGTTIWSYSLDTTKLSDGEHTVKIRVYDDEGVYSEEMFSMTVKNEAELTGMYLAIILIILAIVILSAVALGKKKNKTEITSTQPAIQTETQTLKCPQCQNSFEAPLSSSMVQCPHCGLGGAVK
ncbi:MAG: Ig-like domain-containing protein [Thermoplasmata archaeon]